MKVEDIIKVFRKLIAPLQRKVLLTIGRGVILATKDSGTLQVIQGTFLADEVKSDVEKMHHFGFTSHAPKNSECIMVSVGGNREHGIIIATESRQYRFKDLGEGEAAIYSQFGDYIHLKNGNVIDVKTKTLNIDAETEVNVTTKTANITASTVTNIDSPTTNITGDVNISGEVVAEKSVTVTEDVVATGDVTGDNVIGVTSAGAPTVTAVTSLTVAGQELNDYENHTHDYNDVGAPSNPNTTGPVN